MAKPKKTQKKQKMPAVEIRHLQPHEVEQFFELSDIFLGALPGCANRIQEVRMDKRSIPYSVMCRRAEEIIGGAYITLEPDHAYISFVAFRPKDQGRGIGTALVKYLEDYAKRSGKESVRLETESGQSASWWVSRGYQKAGQDWRYIQLEKPL